MDKLYTGVFGSFLSNSDEDFDEFLNIVRSVLTEKPACDKPKGAPGTTVFLIGLIAAAMGVLLCFHYLKLV
ncbi:B24R [Orf virus]|uniref:B24R n=1 Tax=Orf virus TaxID=10258 RepID=F1AWZ6_ORFV|nr:B24R [Orf virus]